MTLEDEEGFFNLTLFAQVYEKYRLVIQTSTVLAAYGKVRKSWATGSDSRHRAVSIEVERLWDPFLDQGQDIERLNDKDINARDWG